MALLNSDNNYLKLELVGDHEVRCTIYESKEVRDLQKASPSPDKIIKKYKSLIEKARISALKKLEKVNLDTVLAKNAKNVDTEARATAMEIAKPFYDLRIEYNNYVNDLNAKAGAKHDFPLISKYFSNVGTSIENQIGTIMLKVEADQNIDDVYAELKSLQRFGETTDC